MNKAEIKEIDLIIGNKGVVLITKFLGFKVKWRMAKMTLSRMLRLSKIYAKIKIDEDDLKNDDLGVQLASSYAAVIDNAKLAAMVVAVSVDSRIPDRILAWYIMRAINSADLKDFTYKVLQESNFANFTMSIFLMNGSRVSKPKKID